MPNTVWGEEKLIPDHRSTILPAAIHDDWQVALLCAEVIVGLGAPVCGMWMFLRWMGW